MVDVERQKFIGGNNSEARKHKGLPARHPINLLYRAAVIGGSLYGLHSMSVFHAIMRSPEVDHQWFKVGIAGSIAISMIKAYMELYEAKIRKQKVEYQSYKTIWRDDNLFDVGAHDFSFQKKIQLVRAVV